MLSSRSFPSAASFREESAIQAVNARPWFQNSRKGRAAGEEHLGCCWVRAKLLGLPLLTSGHWCCVSACCEHRELQKHSACLQGARTQPAPRHPLTPSPPSALPVFNLGATDLQRGHRRTPRRLPGVSISCLPSDAGRSSGKTVVVSAYFYSLQLQVTFSSLPWETKKSLPSGWIGRGFWWLVYFFQSEKIIFKISQEHLKILKKNLFRRLFLNSKGIFGYW